MNPHSRRNWFLRPARLPFRHSPATEIIPSICLSWQTSAYLNRNQCRYNILSDGIPFFTFCPHNLYFELSFPCVFLMPIEPVDPDENIDAEESGELTFLTAEERDKKSGKTKGPVFSLDLPEFDDADDVFPLADDLEPIHAVPAVIDFDSPLPELAPGRVSIDLDETPAVGGTTIGRMDLGDLIRDFEASRSRPAKPQAEPRHSVESHAPPAANGELSEIERLRAQLETERNNVRRAHADLINLRRKGEKDRDRAVQEANERMIKQVLPIIDDFERSLVAAKETETVDQLVEGVEAILRNFDKFLHGYDIVPIETVGQMFDPDLHEAMGIAEIAEGDEMAEDTIVEEMRRGFTSDGRLLRAAMVRVARRSSPTDEPRAQTESEEQS